ncbi:hypothetical protein AK812_SmicGene8796 [Symbiodinium microadriaticum]|uniref:Uncharacterized protein n=1 Tax=Symbiodinium microadriaticum TaxID=2951 RepID=A0A1Q9EJZ9_SYMMI|nr:hypothetical protein AK812_SmicGene8796 [Symbiodinium microadriaticum]
MAVLRPCAEQYEWGDDFERRHFDGDFVSCMVGAPMRAGQVMNDWDGVHDVDVTMAKDGFSLGHEGLLADTAERYWREKVSKAKAKAKTKRKISRAPFSQ